ncbi:hypothetical protein [Halomonas faecis]|uniref:hypothetical protein n=1 Tax=Halomonas faecis TaxID=1562110 RepID=UPI0013D78942|nr:hypothetical protein [Halomonas faecis]
MKCPLTPAGKKVNPELYHPSLRCAMLRSRYSHKVREAIVSMLVNSLENMLFLNWVRDGRFASYIEKSGLPRRSVELYCGESLVIVVDPKEITHHASMVDSFESKSQGKRARSQFIWAGDWDLKTIDFRSVNRYPFIEDIWGHRDDLSKSIAYGDLSKKLQSGKPLRSYQKGVFLDAPEKIMTYLGRYVGYMKNMQENSFDGSLGKDALAVAVGRDGQLLKLNRGLHRLAMAKVLGLESIVVRIKAVHYGWWSEVTEDVVGNGEKLDSMLVGLDRQ